MAIWDDLSDFSTTLGSTGTSDWLGGEFGSGGGGGSSSGSTWGIPDFMESMWGGFKGLAKEIMPIALPALVGGAASMAFPGEKPKIVGTDPRTGQGRQAEQIRLHAAGSMGSALNDPFAGLTSEEQYHIKRGSRSADAARGSFETGGSAERENQAMQAAIANRRQQNLGNLNAFTSGYQPMNVQGVAGQENPWASLITKAVGTRNAQEGFKRLSDKWWA